MSTPTRELQAASNWPPRGPTCPPPIGLPSSPVTDQTQGEVLVKRTSSAPARSASTRSFSVKGIESEAASSSRTSRLIPARIPSQEYHGKGELLLNHKTALG